MEAHVTLLTWNHACTVGVRAMDDQHGILMDTMNDLRLALVRGSGREQVSELLDRLIEFTRMHFWSEEQLMEQHGFPGLAEHRAEHQRMLAQILQSGSSRATRREDADAPAALAFCATSYAGAHREPRPAVWPLAERTWRRLKRPSALEWDGLEGKLLPEANSGEPGFGSVASS
jgi:hemerythrin-like metal-binding protein